MKKVLKIALIIIATLLIVSLIAASCSDTDNNSTAEPAEGLALNFGEANLTGVTDDSYVVEIKITSDNVSEENLERAIYASAAEFIDTYTPEEIKTISVMGFDQNGELVMTFEMPEGLVTAIRDIAAEGDFGTEGIGAWFWFNDDALKVFEDGIKQ